MLLDLSPVGILISVVGQGSNSWIAGMRNWALLDVMHVLKKLVPFFDHVGFAAAAGQAWLLFCEMCPFEKCSLNGIMP